MALLSREAAARELGIHTRTFDRLLRSPDGACLGQVRIGGRVLYRPEFIQAWIAAQAAEQHEAAVPPARIGAAAPATERTAAVSNPPKPRKRAAMEVRP